MTDIFIVVSWLDISLSFLRKYGVNEADADVNVVTSALVSRPSGWLHWKTTGRMATQYVSCNYELYIGRVANAGRRCRTCRFLSSGNWHRVFWFTTFSFLGIIYFLFQGGHIFALEMQAVSSSKTLLPTYQTKRRLLLLESNLETYCYKNIRFTWWNWFWTWKLRISGKGQKLKKKAIKWIYSHVKFVVKFQIFVFKVMIFVHVCRNITHVLL